MKKTFSCSECGKEVTYSKVKGRDKKFCCNKCRANFWAKKNREVKKAVNKALVEDQALSGETPFL